MNQHQRSELIKRQSRSYTPGSVEYINNQWIFFNDETDEAHPLEEYVKKEIEVYRGSRWKRGHLSEKVKVK